MDETVKNAIIVTLQLALFVIISGSVIGHVKQEEEHRAQYEYMRKEISEQNEELAKLRKELRDNNNIVLKLLEKEW